MSPHPPPPVAYNCRVSVFQACNARIEQTTLQPIDETRTSRYSAPRPLAGNTHLLTRLNLVLLELKNGVHIPLDADLELEMSRLMAVGAGLHGALAWLVAVAAIKW